MCVGQISCKHRLHIMTVNHTCTEIIIYLRCNVGGIFVPPWLVSKPGGGAVTAGILFLSMSSSSDAGRGG